ATDPTVQAPPPTPRTTAPWRGAQPMRVWPGRGARSQAGGMVQKRPGQIEARLKMLGERFHADRLGGVVSRVEHVQSKFFRVEEGVVRTFARDVGVETGGRCLTDQRACRPGHDAHAMRALRAEAEEPRRTAEEAGEPLFERCAWLVDLSPHADGDAVLLAERSPQRHAELARE